MEVTEEVLVELVEGSVMFDAHVEVVGAVAPCRHIIFIPPTCTYIVYSQIKMTARLTKYMVTCFGLLFALPICLC